MKNLFVCACVAGIASCSWLAQAAEEAVFVRNGQAVDVIEQGAGWSTEGRELVGSGTGNYLWAGKTIGQGDFEIRATLSLDRFEHTAASFSMLQWGNFGFDGHGVFFAEGPLFAGHGQKLPATSELITPGEPFEFRLARQGATLSLSIDGRELMKINATDQAIGQFGLRPWRSTMRVREFSAVVEDPETFAELRTREMKTIFKSTRDKNIGTHTYRIPAILETPDKSILAFAEARRDGGGDTCDIDTVVRRSEDGGKTWSPEIVVFDQADNVAGNPCPVVDRETGRIWCLQTWNSRHCPEREIRPGFGEDSRRVFAVYSDDDGRTWSEAKEITRQAKLENWGWYATGPGAAIQLERGPYRGRLIIPCDHKAFHEDGSQTYHSHILYSDDHGETWRLGAETGHGLNECEAVELSDGAVMINSRNHGVDYFNRGVSISRDGGETFDSFRRDEVLIEPRCQASIRRYAWPDAEQPGLILFSNPASKGGRVGLTLRGSYDDGATWAWSEQLYSGGSAYSDIAVLADGRVAVLFERDGYQTIELIILEPDEIADLGAAAQP